MAVITGTSGDNLLQGTTSAYTISGLGGNDQILARAGNDLIYGVDGNDTVWADVGNDALYGGSGNDSLFGGAGNDDIYGGAGNDNLNGGDGDDYFMINSGEIRQDSIYGGAGRDLLFIYDNPNSSIFSINLGVTFDLEVLYISNSNASENLVLHANGSFSVTDVDQIISTGAGIDGVYGGSGDDTIQSFNFVDLEENVLGGGGNDTIWANNGDDNVNGGAGSDILNGEGGDYSLEGGSGNDTLTGGAGADTFRFNLSPGMVTGTDTITDFADGVNTIAFFLVGSQSFADLTIEADAGGGSKVIFGTDQVILSGVDVAALDAEDFTFAV